MDVIADPQLIRLDTERLILRPALGGDALQIRAYHLNNRDHLQPWAPLPRLVFSTSMQLSGASPISSTSVSPGAVCIC